MKKIFVSIIIVISILSTLYCKSYATDEQADLPSSYDLRNDISINVENQGQRGWCNAFAQTKVIQTYLQKTRGINYNLSEAYLSYSEAPYFGGDVEWKTDIETARALVTSFFEDNKSVLESEIPNQDYSFSETNKQRLKDAKSVIKSMEIACLYNNEEVKKHIMTKGGVYLGIDSDEKWYNSYTNAIYCNERREKKDEDIELKTREQVLKYVKETSHHAVTIIGWNDNYSRNNFNSNCRPQNDGAWLILNSWGSNWGKNGTAWVSYEDVGNSVGYNLKMGIDSVLLPGEIHAEFNYEYDDVRNEVIASIKVDDEIEEIEGWQYDSYSRAYIKKYVKEFDSYTIELKSKIDGATTTVEVNIPNEEFEKIKIKNEQEDTKRKEELEKEWQNTMNNFYIMAIFIISIIIFIILIITLISSTSKKNKVVENKSKPKSLKHKFIVVGLILIVLVIIFML